MKNAVLRIQSSKYYNTVLVGLILRRAMPAHEKMRKHGPLYVFVYLVKQIHYYWLHPYILLQTTKILRKCLPILNFRFLYVFSLISRKGAW